MLWYLPISPFRTEGFLSSSHCLGYCYWQTDFAFQRSLGITLVQGYSLTQVFSSFLWECASNDWSTRDCKSPDASLQHVTTLNGQSSSNLTGVLQKPILRLHLIPTLPPAQSYFLPFPSLDSSPNRTF